jgi:hypothetical protein
MYITIRQPNKVGIAFAGNFARHFELKEPWIAAFTRGTPHWKSYIVANATARKLELTTSARRRGRCVCTDMKVGRIPSPLLFLCAIP